MKKSIRLILSVIIFLFTLTFFAAAASTNSVITRTSGKIMCVVSLDEVPENSVIVVSSFKNGRYEVSQLRSVSSDTMETFYFDSETNEISVIVFEDLNVLTPLTAAEKMEVKLDSITDKDWSEWV